MLDAITHTTTATLGFLGPIGWQEMMILGILGILIFGKRLPEVGRSIGQGIVEFKKGLAGVSEDMDATGRRGGPTTPQIDARSAPKVDAPADAVSTDTPSRPA